MDQPTHKTIYLFSGLGADYRVFQNLELAGYRKVFIQWVDPEDGESIAHYAAKIREQVKEELPIFVGVSFGGMVALEVAKQIPVKKIVMISSAKTRAELDAKSSIFLRWRLYKILPASLLRKSNFWVYHLFGVRDPKDKLLLKEILADTDTRFLKWALDELLHWQNEQVPDQFIHIHGTDDHIIPYRNLHPDYSIEGGGHFMVLNRATEINKIILDYLNNE